MCRRDHGLTWAEFQELTLAQLEALEERRATEIRHARFNAALVACAVVNMHRSQDSEPMSPFDFIPGYEPDPAEAARERQRTAIKRSIATVMSRMDTVEAAVGMKAKLIARAKEAGFEDAEELYREVFAEG